MALNILLLVVALAVLTFGAEFLVRGAVVVAKKLGVSSFFIGLTIVGFGTSTPELATGLMAAAKDLDDVNIGNVVGSNIFNIALILGVAAVIAPIPVQLRQVRDEVGLVILVAFGPYLALLGEGSIQRWGGAVLLAGLAGFLGWGYLKGKRDAAAAAEIEKELESEVGALKPGFWTTTLGAAILILVGLAMLTGGSKLLVDSAVSIARTLGVPELVIALTIVSAGTSSPELFTSVVAALRKQSDISVGNILGSNIFNVLGILGVTSLVTPQRVSEQVLKFDAPVMIAVSVALVPIMLRGRRISRGEGVLLLVVFAAYIVALFTVVPGWFPAAGAPE